ncbi:MAG: MarC family protein [Candidatus Binatia bacterium]
MPLGNETIGDFLQATIALLAIANPFAALPVFLSFVPSDDSAAKLFAANRVALAVFAILAGAVLVGGFVLGLFGISFAAFRVGGGLVVTLTGLDMLRGRETASQDDPAAALSAADQLIVPVAMPLIAGPGTIITAMTLTASTSSAGVIPWMMLIAIAVVAAVVWLVLALSGFVQRWVGARGQAIVIRFMGLVLVAVGAQLVLGGIGDFFGLAAGS